jgi:quinol monooxygenase YgiN
MDKLWISAGIEVIDGKDIQQAKDALNNLAIATRQEPGNIAFNVLQQLDKPGSFTLWECWDDATALQQHFNAPHTTAYLAQSWTKVAYIERLQHNEEKTGETGA